MVDLLSLRFLSDKIGITISLSGYKNIWHIQKVLCKVDNHKQQIVLFSPSCLTSYLTSQFLDLQFCKNGENNSTDYLVGFLKIERAIISNAFRTVLSK